MAEKEGKIEFVTVPCPISPRKICSQNIVLRLRRRETIGCPYPGTHVLNARQFYQNVFPNFTVVNVEKPPCFLRKFSPDGRYLIAFSADQTSIEVYEYQGASAASDLLADLKGEYVGHKNDDRTFHIRNNIFKRFFKIKWIVNVVQSNEQLNRECSLFTDDGRYVIAGSAAHIPHELRPHFYQIYSNNEALTPNPRSPLEDYSLHLVDLRGGKLCDSRHFKIDKIYLSHNQGLYLYKDILAVLSVQHQNIHIFQILDGMFINVRTIGRFCLEDDAYLVSRDWPGVHSRPFRDATINCLKHKLLVYLYRRAKYISDTTGDPYELRRFYQYFDQLNALRMWKMQLLDTNHILVRYASEEVATLQASEPNAQPALLVVYDMVTAKVLAAYDNASKQLLTQFENFSDFFRNARTSTDCQYLCSPSNNIYARLMQQRFKQTIVNARYGGLTEATKRLLGQLPISAQSYSSSPYLDLSLFCYDDKWVSMMERPKACGELPIRFYARDSGLLKFRMYAGMLSRTAPVVARRLVAFTFHPTDPFAISVQRTNAEYIAHSINAEHKDLIHDIAYDFYGQRMATCSSDQFVKVWDEDEHENWHQTASWKAHSGSVWKVTWAHPEFGQVLATCSFDRTAAVWEEIVGEGSGPGERGMRHWVRRTNLVDSRTSVTDVKFGPKTLGLLLATCSADGVIRIYEAPDVMNLSQWTLQHDISCKLACSCLTWNPSLSRLHPPMIAVGSDDSSVSVGGKVFIYEYSDNSRRWAKTETLSNVVDPVHDIAFAPNLGRSFHTLAIATKDVRIITLKPMQDTAQNGLSRFEITTAAQFDDHYCTVWRVCWNIMGTILASSGDDGCVRLWKDNYINNWKCVAVLKGDGTSAQSAEVPQIATPPSHSVGSQPPLSTTRTVSIATVTAERPTISVTSGSKWQGPVTKGRFSKTVWLGNPSEPSPPPPPILDRPRSKK